MQHAPQINGNFELLFNARTPQFHDRIDLHTCVFQCSERPITVYSATDTHFALMASAPSSGESAFKRRPQSFRHPSGRMVHVASTPEVAETLRKTLTETHGADNYDLYLKGSDEHVRDTPRLPSLVGMAIRPSFLTHSLSRSKRFRKPVRITRSGVSSYGSGMLMSMRNSRACTASLMPCRQT